jgi:hypothetical protein
MEITYMSDDAYLNPEHMKWRIYTDRIEQLEREIEHLKNLNEKNLDLIQALNRDIDWLLEEIPST